VDLLKVFLFHHLFPVILGSALTLFLVLFLTKIFFIKRPSLRHLFLFIPLIKPLPVLINGLSIPRISELPWHDRHLAVSLQLPDPLNLIDSSSEKFSRLEIPDMPLLQPWQTELFSTLLTTAVFVVAALIFVRWAALYAYRKGLAAAEEVDHAKYPKVYESAGSLSRTFKIMMPKIVLADVPCPLMIGFKGCTVALPHGSLDKLTEDELEATLAHEFAHIKRGDNFKLWAAIMCRDLMFFNPFAWIAFRLLATERERAADYLAAKVTNKPLELASAIFKAGEKLSAIPVPQPSLGIAKSDLAPRLDMTRRVNDLLNFRPYRRIILRIPPLILLFLLLFYARFFIHIKFPNDQIFSFFG